jgi:ribosomal protein L11 methyltransferase
VAEPGVFFTLLVTVEPDRMEIIQALFSQTAPWGWEECVLEDGLVCLTAHFESLERRKEAAEICRQICPDASCKFQEIHEQNWSTQWKEFFSAVPVGSDLVILPSWEKNNPSFPGRLPLYIEPQMAFGTGHHPTTVLCLEVLLELVHSGRIRPGGRFLDLGTGSGILGIACVQRGLKGLGLDIDPTALANAEANSILNDAGPALKLQKGSIHNLLGEDPFDLVLANILAEPLKRMAKNIVSALTPGGCLVLSGILGEQAGAVAEKYLAQGLGEPRVRHSGEWAALIWA